MKSLGYGGSVLRINLSDRTFTVEDLDLDWMHDVVGGRAANTKRLIEELDVTCDPLSPENLLIFGIGPLTGSILPASAYYTVSAKSPQTGILGDSAAGGQFAAEMKLTGYDQIIIRGRADRLLYLLIHNEGVEFIECPHLKNQTVNTATSLIRKENRDHSIQVAAIGTAGENQVRFSAIVSSGNRVNSRSGMGAVMGSKNLKALALHGKKSICFYDSLKLKETAERISKKIFGHPEYEKRNRLGTTMLMNDLNGIGILPTRHFQEGVCDYLEKISGEYLAEHYKIKNKSCFNCPVHCSRYYRSGRNEAEGPEFETLCGFTSRIGNSDIRFALEMNEYLNQEGMDSLSTCEVIGWLMECQENGLVTPGDIDGISLSWGDTENVRKLVRKIVHREGVGDRLADGATEFSRQFSAEAQKLVMQVKGLDLICGDPRGIKAYGLTYAIASRGGDHLRAEPYFELTEQWDVAKERFGTEKAADRLSEEGKARLVTYSEKIALLTDCMTICKNIGLCMDVIDFDVAVDLIGSSAGVFYDSDELAEVMGQGIQRDRALNKKFGMTSGMDTLPDRFLKEPLTDGSSKGSVVDISKMVREYYDLHDWEPDDDRGNQTS